MASRDLTYSVGVDASDAVSGLRKLEGAVSSTMREVEGELEDSASAGDKFASSIDRLSSQLKADFDKSTTAAKELKRALQDVDSGIDVGDAIAQLSKMGFTFDEITADADKFAASLKQLDDVRLEGVKQLDDVAPGLATKLDDVQKSADSSKGALANMIGNSAQDLGELGGIAGSAGVAVGQMAEYFADAAFEGEGLGSVMKNMGAVVGPILLITAAVSAVTGAMQAQKARTEETARVTDEFGEAMSGAADDSVGFAAMLRENEDAMSEFWTTSLLGEGFASDVANVVNDAGRNIPLLGRLFQDLSVDVPSALDAVGISIHQFGTALNGTKADQEAFLQLLQDDFDAGLLTSDQLKATTQIFTEYAGAVDKAREAQSLYNVDADEANALLGELVAKEEPLAQMGETWATLFEDMADGSIDTKEAATAINELAAALGLTQEEVIGLAREHLDEELESEAQAAQDAADAAAEYAVAVAGAEQELHKLGSTFSLMGLRSGALADVFKVGSSGVEAASATRDIAAAIGELQTAADGVDLSVPLDPANLGADKLLDALDGLRPEIQGKIQEAFALGGPTAAKETADAYVAQIVEAMGGQLTPAEVEQMLGLTDLTAQIAVALEISQIEAVRQQLAVLTGVAGTTPLTASIALALDAGTITPEAAEILVQGQLSAAGVVIPSTLDTPDTAAAIAEAERFAKKDPATIVTDADMAGAEDDLGGFIRKPHETTIAVGADKKKAADDILAEETKVRKAIILAEAVTQGAQRELDTLDDPIRAPVEAYLADYPTKGEIERAIGRPRIPVDIVVGQTIRITGVRE